MKITKSFVLFMVVVLVIAAQHTSGIGETWAKGAGSKGKNYGPEVGKGKKPRISPVNRASSGDIRVYLTEGDVTIDGVINQTEWQDATIIWFII